MSNAGTASLTVDERDYYERQIFDLRQLLEVSKILNSTLDYATLIDSILYSIMGQFKVLRAGLFAKKGIDSPWLSFHRNYKGFEVAKAVDYSISEDHPAIRLFQRQYGCYTLDDLQGRFGSLKGLEALTALKPDLVVPLKVKGVINGIIVIGERIEGESDFTPLEREYLINVAVMAAIAINNAFLFEMTTTDMMTRLKMKHYFYSVLLERMERSGISGKPLSVMMLDIDHFKHFNDEHGHQCGDAVLKNVAQVLQKLVRGEDIAARYGGEEFCVLLPDTDGQAAGFVAERIRSAVARSVVEYEGKRLSVTISIGVAQFQATTDYTAKVIIERADRALYSSKADGRNRTTIAGS
jgi:diguanylate cyclase (GGDEF)-like protein